MFTHEQIWLAIDRLATSRGYSPSGLAKKAGLDPTTFNKSKRTSADGKPRWPSTESVSKILTVTGASMAEMLTFMEGEGESALHPVASGPLDQTALRKGDMVVIQKTGTKELLTAELREISGAGVKIRMPDAPHEESALKKADIAWIARLAWIKS